MRHVYERLYMPVVRLYRTWHDMARLYKLGRTWQDMTSLAKPGNRFPVRDKDREIER